MKEANFRPTATPHPKSPSFCNKEKNSIISNYGIIMKVADPFFVNLSDMQTQRDTSLQNCECQNANMQILTRDVSNRSGSPQVLAKPYPDFRTGIQNTPFVRTVKRMDSVLRQPTTKFNILCVSGPSPHRRGLSTLLVSTKVSSYVARDEINP